MTQLVSYDVVRRLVHFPAPFLQNLLGTLAQDVPTASFLEYVNVALTEAVESGNRDALLVVLAHRPRYRDLAWALLYCLTHNRLEEAQLLLDRSPGLLDYDLEQPEQGQATILATLVEDGREDAVRWVLERGARPDAHYGLAVQVAGAQQRWGLLELMAGYSQPSRSAEAPSVAQYGLDLRRVGSDVALAYLRARGEAAIPALRAAFARWLI